MARILQADGYQTTTNQTVSGLCITHEIDVIAIKDTKNYLVECKFHNNIGLKTDVKVPLYIQARFEDIIASEKRILHVLNLINHGFGATHNSPPMLLNMLNALE